MQGSDTKNERTLWWLHEKNRALRVGDWKIVASGAEAPWELYNLAGDRTETENRAAKEPERLESLVKQWTKQLEEYQALARLTPDLGNAGKKANAKKNVEK
jgi:arylsulfatase